MAYPSVSEPAAARSNPLGADPVPASPAPQLALPHPSSSTLSPSMRSECAARLWNVLRDSTLNGWHDEILSDLSLRHYQFLSSDWQSWARHDQLPPQPENPLESWRVWVILGGRGAGKTRAGAEWVRAMALGEQPYAAEPATRIALIGETVNDVRRVMIEGVSGLLAVHRDGERPEFEPSKSQLTWPNGSVAQMFSADNPDSLRGPQFAAAWCDELAKWRMPETAWDMLQFGLRLGNHPQVAVTTTPRPIPLLKRLLADTATVVTRAATAANKSNLSPGFIAEMTRRYAGTALGRQELDGEIVEDMSGALWQRAWINDTRVRTLPDLARIVVAVDPPVTATAASDACGIVVAGISPEGHGYVIADRTVQGREPHAWARAVVAAYHEFMADRVVAEVNQGGDLVVTLLRQIDAAVAVRKVHATRGKWLRAEPIAALYAEGRVHHHGTFEELEEQMRVFGSGGMQISRSPDRLDALVWALTDLMLAPRLSPRVRAL
jgi:phage terminase large subunit-like protein